MKNEFTKEEKIAFEIEKIKNDPEAASKFKSIAIGRQKSAFKKEYAEEQFDMACSVIRSAYACDGCNDLKMCMDCPLHLEHLKAVAEIESGKRHYIPKEDRQKKPRTNKHSKDDLYRVHMSFEVATGAMNIRLEPVGDANLKIEQK